MTVHAVEFQSPSLDLIHELVTNIGESVAHLNGVVPVQPDSCRIDLLEALKQIDQLVSWSESMRNVLTVAAVGTEPISLSKTVNGRSNSVYDIRSIELAAVLGISPHASRNLVNNSRLFVAQLPQVQSALADGTLTAYKSRIICDGASDLRRRFNNAEQEMSVKIWQRFQNRVLQRAGELNVSQLRRRVNLTVARMSPMASVESNLNAQEERTVTLTPAGDQMAWLNAYLPALEASRVWQVLNHAAKNDPLLTGSMEQKMADAFVGIIDGTCELSPELRNATAELQILVSLSDLTKATSSQSGMCRKNPELTVGNGLSETQVLDPKVSNQIVGEISTTGLLVEGHALLGVLADAKFRRILFDPDTGGLLDFGRQTYRPPKNLRQHVKMRDNTCRAPGCVRNARYCDLDHTRSWDSGGNTSQANLAALCRTHHLLKTHGEWQYEIASDGRAHWTLPGQIQLERSVHRLVDEPGIKHDPDPPPF